MCLEVSRIDGETVATVYVDSRSSISFIVRISSLVNVELMPEKYAAARAKIDNCVQREKKNKVEVKSMQCSLARSHGGKLTIKFSSQFTHCTFSLSLRALFEFACLTCDSDMKGER